MAPKFQTVSDYLSREIAPLGFAHWNDPKGGYFVSLYTMPGTRQTGLGAVPGCGYYHDGGRAPPILMGRTRTMPTFGLPPVLPPVAELEQAMEVLCVCLKLAALEKLLAQ